GSKSRASSSASAFVVPSRAATSAGLAAISFATSDGATLGTSALTIATGPSTKVSAAATAWPWPPGASQIHTSPTCAHAAMTSRNIARASWGSASRVFPWGLKGTRMTAMPKSLSPDNGAVADALERYAALLDLNGSSHHVVRAYRRAAELIRALPAPVAELVRNGRVRELRGIGPGPEARFRGLVQTGEVAHARELEGELEPELVGLGRFLGISPRQAVELGRALGARTPDELREAVSAGRLESVRGIGPKTAARLRAALEREPEPRARRGI